MQISLASSDNKSETISISDTVFDCKFNEPLVHQIVTAYLAAGRQGTHAQKNRSAVRGGGKKPWKQKGTGRARAGTIRSPIWRKGGVTFAAQTQDYSQKVNKKMYRKAMCCIFSELVRQNRLLVVDSFSIDTAKTKALLSKLKTLGLDKGLIIADNLDENLYLAARNLTQFDVRDASAADPVSLISFDKVLITTTALKQFEELLA